MLVVDPFYFGESKFKSHDYLFALLVSAVGERPLGIQTAQVAAIARWAASRDGSSRVELSTYGPRSSLIALTAAALEDKAITQVTLRGGLLAVVSGALTSGMGYALWFAALRGLTAAQAAIVQLTVPPLAAAGAVLFLGERPTLRLAVAGLLILGGVGLAVGGRRAGSQRGRA